MSSSRFYALSLVSVLIMVLWVLDFDFALKRPKENGQRAENTYDEMFPQGKIHPLLHAQGLSHQAFHSRPFKEALISKLPKPHTVLIVGTEYGFEMAHFANGGKRVIAVEPARRYLKYLNRLIKKHPDWNVTLFPFAAGKETSSLSLQYPNGNITEEVKLEKLDNHVSEPVALMSIDVQGAEIDALVGASRLLKSSVSSIWFEIGSCRDQVGDLFRLLDEDFVMFDFALWGSHKSNEDSSNPIPTGRASYVFDPQRPSEFNEYLAWMCNSRGEAKLRQRNYKWLQNDIVAIRRKFLGDMLPTLRTLAQDVCPIAENRCVLRSRLHEAKEMNITEQEIENLERIPHRY